MARLRTALLLIVMAAAGVYFVLYLYGWEWYRAQIVGIVFVAAEIAAVASHLSSVIRRGSVGSSASPARAGRAVPDAGGREVAAEVLTATPRSDPDTFRWLQDASSQTSVFIPLLLGAGVLMSAIAWIMEHLAGAVYGDRIDESVSTLVSTLVPPDSLIDAPTHHGLLTTPGHWDDFRPKQDSR